MPSCFQHTPNRQIGIAARRSDISSFSAAGYLIGRLPIRRHAFFEQDGSPGSDRRTTSLSARGLTPEESWTSSAGGRPGPGIASQAASSSLQESPSDPAIVTGFCAIPSAADTARQLLSSPRRPSDNEVRSSPRPNSACAVARRMSPGTTFSAGSFDALVCSLCFAPVNVYDEPENSPLFQSTPVVPMSAERRTHRGPIPKSFDGDVCCRRPGARGRGSRTAVRLTEGLSFQFALAGSAQVRLLRPGMITCIWFPIRTVCRHALVKVFGVCPNAAACLGAAGGKYMAKVLHEIDGGREVCSPNALAERSALSLSVGGS